MFSFITKLFDNSQKEITKLLPIIEKINSYSGNFQSLSLSELKLKTKEFKDRLKSGENLDGILPEAFAVVREASVRAINERPFDVQMISAVVLHQGKISEQKTGEGKTLSATPALYLNALMGKGVHLVTVNDYLARRDCGWMGPLFYLLGISVSALIHDQSFIYDPAYNDPQTEDWRLKHLKPVKRKEAYLTDITYGINSEFGFDYLRDNMVQDVSELVQREFYFAVVDEVDSVLIDEARTPHIISMPDARPTEKYNEYAKIVDKLSPKIDFEIDEKHHTAHFTEHGILKIEKLYGLDNIYEKDFDTIHHLEASLKAKTLFHREKEYIVKEGEVIIVDEFTGRLMPGRRFSEGIHQAIEAKEGVIIQQESRTLATVSLQNYFRMYKKLAGMTGTAITEAEEFNKIYHLEVIPVPTNKPLIRSDRTDVVYKTTRAKYAAIAGEIEECYKKGQPVLVGTTSIEKNEIISQFLKRKGIPHQVLNAKNHLREAFIISNAGTKNAVTVATNMAGRGVDIILGGAFPNKYTVTDKKQYEQKIKDWQKAHQEVLKAGGLHVIGTERHESRRIDNQLRGRSGRQGDPGSTRFFISLEDDIMRIFGGDQVSRLMTLFNLPENIPLEHPMVSRAIQQAQVKVEGFNFDTRKHLVEYDDIMNKQREIIYAFRRQILLDAGKEKIKEEILEIINKEIRKIVAEAITSKYQETDNQKIIADFSEITPINSEYRKELLNKLNSEMNNPNEQVKLLIQIVSDVYQKREREVGNELMRQIGKWVLLQVIDSLWMDHLDSIDDLREGIGLRGYGQRDPLVEYKSEAFSLFEKLMALIDFQIARRIFKVEVAPSSGIANITRGEKLPKTKKDLSGPANMGSVNRIGRNDPCWCGSGKKWKKCHYPQAG